ELAMRAGQKREASVMAVWAIAWAGSKPLASLTDGLLAGGIGVTWGGTRVKWEGLGMRWTGTLLALPALVPVLVLVALPVTVLVMPKWQPPEGRRSHALDKLSNFPWIRRAEELLVRTPQLEMIEETPIGA